MLNQATFEQAVDPKAAQDLEFRLIQFDQSKTKVSEEVRTNEQLDVEALRNKVLYGRSKQATLSAQIRNARQQKNNDDEVNSLTEIRRLFHISTILARAELLCREKEATMSQYVGDEAKFDDSTILERAIGFCKLELDATTSADDRGILNERIGAFQKAEDRVSKTDY